MSTGPYQPSAALEPTDDASPKVSEALTNKFLAPVVGIESKIHLAVAGSKKHALVLVDIGKIERSD